MSSVGPDIGPFTIRFTVTGKNPAELQHSARYNAAGFFGPGQIDISIGPAQAETAGGVVLRWKAEVTAHVTPSEPEGKY